MSIKELFDRYTGDYKPSMEDGWGEELLTPEEFSIIEDRIARYADKFGLEGSVREEYRVRYLLWEIRQKLEEKARMQAEAAEDEADRQAYEAAMEEFRKNPITHSHEEVLGVLEDDADLDRAAKVFVEFMEDGDGFDAVYVRICDELERLTDDVVSVAECSETQQRIDELLDAMVFGQEVIINSYMFEHGWRRIEGQNGLPRWEREDARKILEGMNTPIEECIPEDKVDWDAEQATSLEKEYVDAFARRHGVQCFGSSPAQIMTPEESAELAAEWAARLAERKIEEKGE